MSVVPGATRPVALVVEDDRDVAELLETVLIQAGFEVHVASNGADGIALARRHSPVLATIDVAMPQMDGLEATRRIREFSGTYIVIVSTRSREADILAGFEAGADDYVPKPIRPLELRARLAAVADRSPDELLSRGWQPADEDAARAAYLRRVASGELPDPVPATVPGDPEHDEDDDGEDGREGMLAVGMRFVGGWVDFRGLRINPGRGIVVVDDRLVDLRQEQVDLLEVLLYAGSRTVGARRLALRLRHETEATATRQRADDERWVDALMRSILIQVKDDGSSPRWIESLPRHRYRLVRPTDQGFVSDDATA